MVCGDEPAGAKLAVAHCPHDYGTYLDVVCWYDGNDPAAAAYAARVDEQCPTTWEQAGMTPPRPQTPEDAGKRYVGTVADGGLQVMVHRPDGTAYPLPPRLDLRNHSPSGFAHGYEGSGPAQLALALCADATGDDRLAEQVYQAVKRKLVAGLSGDAWELDQAQVLAAVSAAAVDRGRRGW